MDPDAVVNKLPVLRTSHIKKTFSSAFYFYLFYYYFYFIFILFYYYSFSSFFLFFFWGGGEGWNFEESRRHCSVPEKGWSI